MNKHEARIRMFSVFYPFSTENLLESKLIRKTLNFSLGGHFIPKGGREDFTQKGGHVLPKEDLW
jgi:hypothetical protein